jgi:vacuolar-type H+-ATPase subunit E/Vma4
MSLKAILEAIEASGQAEQEQIRAETASRLAAIEARVQREAESRREAIRRLAFGPAGAERSRRLHRARLEALRLRGQARDQLIEQALQGARLRLAALRHEARYPEVLQRLALEALRALDAQPASGAPRSADQPGAEDRPTLEVDRRDLDLIRRILGDLDLSPRLEPALETWGGVVARSADGRIVATNTLETRLERALPYLRRELARQIEQASARAEPVG